MACRFLYGNIWDQGSVDALTEASGYPAVNTQHHWHLKTWRSTSSNQDNWIKCEFSSPRQASAIVIFNNNVNSINQSRKLYFQGSNDGFITAPLSLQWSLPNYCQVAFFNPCSYKYWRAYILTGSSSDNFFQIGRIFLGNYFEPKRNFMSVSYEYIDPSKIHYSKSGQLLTVQESKYKILNYVFQIDSEDMRNFEIIFNNVGLGGDLFFCENTNDPSGSTIYCRLVKFTAHYLFKNLWRIEITLEQLR